MGDVHHPGEYHMLMVFVAVETGQVSLQFIRIDLSHMPRDCKHLVSRILDRAGLMHSDMPRLGCNDTLISSEHPAGYHSICLRTSHQEIHICMLAPACSPYFLPGAFTVRIAPVTG